MGFGPVRMFLDLLLGQAEVLVFVLESVPLCRKSVVSDFHIENLAFGGTIVSRNLKKPHL